jgi:hypothetical protein
MKIEDIEDFKKKYDNHIENIVFPEIIKFEKDRKIRLTLVNLTIIVCSLLFISTPVISASVGKDYLPYLIFCSLLPIISVKPWAKKIFEDKVKTMVMPIIMKSIPGFYWRQTSPITTTDIKNCMILPLADIATTTFDDCFIGEYRNINIAISECKHYTREKNYFEGVIIKLDMNKNFNGNTVIRPRCAANISSEIDLKLNKIKKINLEDPSFNEKFFIYSTDEIEARYLLTPTFMERLYNTGKAFGSNFEYCAFYENSIYIALNTDKDMFDLCDLNTPLDDKEQFDILFEEFASILGLVDHFKLDQKLGL